MRVAFILFIIFSSLHGVAGQARTIHVYVALCDNRFQGIVPVPKNLGNGKVPRTNLYWGAAYGLKSYFEHKTDDWELLKSMDSDNPMILERVIFMHKTEEVYLLADAYDGEKINYCVEDFLKASNGQNPIQLTHQSQELVFGGSADLVCYVGHNGLMDFDVDINYHSENPEVKDVMILTCYSKDYFSNEMVESKTNPILWTTHLMAPEAYTLKSAIDGWILNESGKEIDERAAQTYNNYQNCGISGARNLFTTGF
ncbi:MAG: hypothetical protein AAGA66_14600 [Bacteroidota bacterium]